MQHMYEAAFKEGEWSYGAQSWYITKLLEGRRVSGLVRSAARCCFIRPAYGAV